MAARGRQWRASHSYSPLSRHHNNIAAIHRRKYRQAVGAREFQPYRRRVGVVKVENRSL